MSQGKPTVTNVSWELQLTKLVKRIAPPVTQVFNEWSRALSWVSIGIRNSAIVYQEILRKPMIFRLMYFSKCRIHLQVISLVLKRPQFALHVTREATGSIINSIYFCPKQNSELIGSVYAAEQWIWCFKVWYFGWMWSLLTANHLQISSLLDLTALSTSSFNCTKLKN